jgi:hypothetical protein
MDRNAPRLTAPLPQGSQVVIPATQPAQRPQTQANTPLTPGDDAVVPSSQPARGRGRPPRARGTNGARGSQRARGGARGGTVRASIQRTPSQWEGTQLEGSDMTAIGGGLAVPASSGTRGRGTQPARVAPRTASSRPSSTAGVAKRVTRSQAGP